MNWAAHESNSFPACRSLVTTNAQHVKHLHAKTHRSCAVSNRPIAPTISASDVAIQFFATFPLPVVDASAVAEGGREDALVMRRDLTI